MLSRLLVRYLQVKIPISPLCIGGAFVVSLKNSDVDKLKRFILLSIRYAVETQVKINSANV